MSRNLPPITYQNVCNDISAKLGTTIVPETGTENNPADFEYLLTMIDKANGNVTNFAVSKYADSRFVDTTAVIDVCDALLVPGGTFVAFDSGNGTVISSADGVTWTSGTFTLPTSAVLRDICCDYDNNTYFAIGVNSDKSRCVFSSPDGLTWTEKEELPRGGAWDALCYGKGTFVAVNSNPDNANLALYSSDAVNWVRTIMPVRAGWVDVCYGNGTFTTLRYGEGGQNDYTTNHAAYSTNGVDWALATLPYTGIWRGLAYGNGRFVAVEYHGATAYSTDGIHWTRGVQLSHYDNWCTVSYGNGVFVAVGKTTAAYSRDGITWTSATPFPTGVVFSDVSVCYGN